MPNDTVRASATALPTSSRRLFLAAGTAAAVCATLKSAAALAGEDAEILALSAEILRLNGIADDIGQTRILPFEAEFGGRIRDGGYTNSSIQEAFEFSRQCGREGAIEDQQKVDAEADRHFRRMMALAATTQPGRAAKVRALLVHVMRDGWRGDADGLDWDKEQARALLAEFAGMGAEEIANV